METTLVVSVDAETNGLGGEIFAIGAVAGEVRLDAPSVARVGYYFANCPITTSGSVSASAEEPALARRCPKILSSPSFVPVPR